MTRARANTPRLRTIERMERAAGHLQVDALELYHKADGAGERAEANTWWNISAALAEAARELKALRGAPGLGPALPAKPEPVRDWLGVAAPNPDKECPFHCHGPLDRFPGHYDNGRGQGFKPCPLHGNG